MSEMTRQAAILGAGGAAGRRLALLVAIAIIIVLPMIVRTSYWQSILLLCALNAVLALGLNLTLGYAGQLNLGHSAFYGIGAYVSTLLVKDLGFGYWLAFIAGGLAAGLAGIVLSMFAVRLKGHYLGIASLGFALVVYEILTNWLSVTRGPLGIYGVRPPPPVVLPGFGRIDFSHLPAFFYLVAGFATLVYLALDSLLRSPIGECLRTIREDEISAASLGVNGPYWKIFAFGLGGALAGAAGALYASFVGTLVPDSFFITESFTLLAMVIVGGIGTMPGPVIGAIVLTVLPEALRGIGDLRFIVYGLAMTAAVLFLPGGLMQGWAALRARWRPGLAR